ncbi:hypothetical protein HZS_1826 [Henneguya salminicola]|nr:hypothetical protein HZS_1826 [Henneguya salminicola]
MLDEEINLKNLTNKEYVLKEEDIERPYFDKNETNYIYKINLIEKELLKTMEKDLKSKLGF